MINNRLEITHVIIKINEKLYRNKIIIIIKSNLKLYKYGVMKLKKNWSWKNKEKKQSKPGWIF